MGKVFDEKYVIVFLLIWKAQKGHSFWTKYNQIGQCGTVCIHSAQPSCMGGFEKKKKSTRPSSIMLLFFFSFNDREKNAINIFP